MIMKKEGIFTIKKEGSFYRVYRKRKRIGRFLLLSEAEKYFRKRIEKEEKTMQAIFIGYDIPLALDIKWDEIMPILSKAFKAIQYEGDTVHIINNNESDITFVQTLLLAYNTHRDINLTLDVFKVNESLLKA
ncbi:hypothetical protein [Cytobacillus purgationiresistens]|uniref:Uncharacterized protein n=1 Tax=Cytobacillus purgationiresistens TaxID=863449 RepID=A0ABU0AIR1_9BACI|nr:hypothetical protein [Cytobacillus purgationiresistens]MDQ0271152.1 hypothetical protein [Cytobacillus purgationiresistens]